MRMQGAGKMMGGVAFARGTWWGVFLEARGLSMFVATQPKNKPVAWYKQFLDTTVLDRT